jgi:hypothetical protein
MDGRRERNPQPAAKEGARRPYRTPRLARLGTLHEITANIGTDGKNDHSNGPVKTT